MSQFWVIAPYFNKTNIFEKVWEYDLKNGVIGVGWSELGNIMALSKDEYLKLYQEKYPNGSTHDRNSFWSFHHEIAIGDRIIARRGRKEIIAVGEVTGKPYYNEKEGLDRIGGDPSQHRFSNFLPVRWRPLQKRFFNIKFPMNTISNVTENEFADLIKPLFSWIPIYEELAEKVLEYKNRQHELIAYLKEIGQGIPMLPLEDQDAQGLTTELKVIDPFTFFASFNRGIKEEHRIHILQYMKKKFGLQSPLPSDFSGTPTANNMNSWFFPYAKDRSTNNIQNLWELAESAIKKPDIESESFNRCLKIKQVALGKLTVGLFWLRPRKFLPYDSKTRDYLEEKKSIKLYSENADGYVSLLKEVQDKISEDFPKISDDAYWYAGLEDNGIIAEILAEDLNLPYTEWKTKIDDRITPVFKKLNKLVMEDNQGLLANATTYKRKPGDSASTHECLARYTWKLNNPSFPLGISFNLFVQLGDYGMAKDQQKVFWGAYWWGKTEIADEVFKTYEVLSPSLTVIKKDSSPLFGGTNVRILAGELMAEQVMELDEDAKDMIVEGLIPVIKRLNEFTGKPSVIKPPVEPSVYTKQMALAELFIDPKQFYEICQAVLHKKNVILQGPPGTGKTFLARRLAYTLLGEKASTRVEMIQFHQSYSYEDFIQGYRPTEKGTFELRNGAFFEFVLKAQ